jgi:gliding motility-associated-like protein
LTIFNRWGMPVYETANYRNQWTGEGVPDGTYYYVLALDDGREFTGHVTLLR